MPDVLWSDVRAYLDNEVEGSLPDVYVADTSIDDWQALLDLIVSCGWRYEFSENDAVMRLPRARDVLPRPHDAVVPLLRVWPAPNLEAIFRPLSVDEIWFDLDAGQLQGQDRLDLLCAFLRAIGRHLRKPVIMTPEGGDERHPILGFDVETDRVVLLASR